ncbi:STAS domain-containing protein [Streptomyces sp. NPDC086989]|uniref:STAS domain-containing protein n=1 Tax=Streptomyces sp. NPDC086989 TaxID=3365764 RepID=UPI0038189773
MITGLHVSHARAPTGTRVLALTGEADLDGAPLLARALNEALDGAEAPMTLVVDCSGLRFCDCAGLNEFLRARRAAATAGIAVRLAGPGPQFTRLLDLTGTYGLFDVQPALELTRTGMCIQASALAAQVELQAGSGQWELSRDEIALAHSTSAHLAEAVGPATLQEVLPGIERLERLREALAALAIGIAHTHGQLAWFLARTATVLAPVLQWRALTAEGEKALGTVVPSAAEFTDAEDAVRLVHTLLARTTSHGPGTKPVSVQPDTVG